MTFKKKKTVVSEEVDDSLNDQWHMYMNSFDQLA